MSPPQDLIEQLVAHRTIGSAPRHELEWLAANGILREIKTGEVVGTKGQLVDYMQVVLTGVIAIFVERGAALQKAVEWRGGDVTGNLPYSRLTRPPGNSVGIENSTVLSLHKDKFPELIRECPELTSMLVHQMLDRARMFTSSALHDEKLVSLGKLSAGLAHELNNPASAIERSASLLQKRLEDADSAARALGASRLSEEQLAAVDGLRTACVVVRVPGVRSPIEQAEREEAIADWLGDHGIDVELSDTLAETTVTIEALDHVASLVNGPALDAAVRAAAAGCSVRSLAADIHEASMRIAGLVLAIKGFTHMDQAAAPEEVDLASSLANTVTVLRAKARAKSATVRIDVEPDLPRVRGFLGELNQIWANLIDNALDAIPDSGRVDVTAKRQDQRVCVRVIDDGPGIPPEIRQRIFDPFFTTKPVGHGTGLGLDIVLRLVSHNEGELSVDTVPGRTEFRVALPIADGTGGGAGAPGGGASAPGGGATT
jgi:signal transduction histidine kinase